MNIYSLSPRGVCHFLLDFLNTDSDKLKLAQHHAFRAFVFRNLKTEEENTSSSNNNATGGANTANNSLNNNNNSGQFATNATAGFKIEQRKEEVKYLIKILNSLIKSLPIVECLRFLNHGLIDFLWA